MPVITAIERQKRNSSRVNVFVDGGYSFACNDDLIAEYHLFVDKELSSKKLKKIKYVAIFSKLVSRVLNLLSRRPRSKFEIIQKMQEYFYKDKVEDKSKFEKDIVDYLEERKYISDLEFGRWFVDSRLRQQKKSWAEIMQELRVKRLANEDLSTIENDYLGDIDKYEVETIKKSLTKKSSTDKYEISINDQYKIKNKLFMKGFRGQNIDAALGN